MIGQRLLHYEIIEKLGEGGMGVVYKARDAHLDRFVAIKVLPPEKVADPQRKARFVQEAKAASALNHPNIVHIYDISSDGGTDFIAMEYVAGKTLDQLIPRRGMPLNEALKIAVQIADALARAHAAGITHRDLKPSNIMVDEHGLVKVLDFGLAKLTEAVPISEDEATRTLKPTTEEGTIVGTAAYMSPEQAEGKKLDARSDIFSFGAVLYEMVTGRRAFQGDSKMSTLSAVLHQEPRPLEDVPHDLEKTIRRCLRKAPDKRWQAASDLKVVLDELKEESDSGLTAEVTGAPRRGRRRFLWAGAVAVFAGFAATAWLRLSKPSAGPPPKVTTFFGQSGLPWGPALSADGNQVAFVWDGQDRSNSDIYVQLLDESTPRRLTTHPSFDFCPIWSPDGLRIAFVRQVERGSEILVIPAAGGEERRLIQSSATCAPANQRFTTVYCGISWSPDGKSLTFVDRDDQKSPYAIYLFDLQSRNRRKLTSPPVGWFGDGLSVFSPDGRSLAFLRILSPYPSDIYLLPLSADKSPAGEPRRITRDAVNLLGFDWTADGTGLLFSSVRAGSASLWRVSASGGEPERLSVGGENAHWPSLARRTRRLAYTHTSSSRNLWRLPGPGPDAAAVTTGAPASFMTSPNVIRGPAFSRDGKRIAFTSNRSGNTEVWICNADGSSQRRLTYLATESYSPRWSTDGRRVAFYAKDKDGQFYSYWIDSEGGVAHRLTAGRDYESHPSWSHDGQWIYFASRREGYKGETTIWKAAVDGGLSVQVVNGFGGRPRESPDGRHLYYTRVEGRQLWRKPVEGGDENLVLEKGPRSLWDLSEAGICLLDPDAVGGPAIEFVYAQTGKRIRLLKLPKDPASYYRDSVGAVAISPDSRWIIYEQIDREDSEIMLVENFR